MRERFDILIVRVLSGKVPGSFAVLDLMRLPLGILTGMGFIGAGAVFRKDGLVSGVTTAAMLWFVTIIGLCFGGGAMWVGCGRQRARTSSVVGFAFRRTQARAPQGRMVDRSLPDRFRLPSSACRAAGAARLHVGASRRACRSGHRHLRITLLGALEGAVRCRSHCAVVRWDRARERRAMRAMGHGGISAAHSGSPCVATAHPR